MNFKARFILVMQLILLALYNLAHPVTPTLLDVIHAPVYVFGVLLAIMSGMQFFFAPFWGRISDRFGRRIMFLGPLGYAVGQLIFAYATTPLLLFIARAISGMFAVITFTVNMAYLADQTAPEQRGRAMTLLAMMTALGTSLGYFLGGQLGALHYQYPFFAQTLAGIVIAGIFYVMTRSEYPQVKREKQQRQSQKQQWQHIVKHYRQTPLVFLLAITFFGVLAYVAYNSSIPYYLTAQYGADSASVGNFVALINLAAVAVNFGLLPLLRKYVSDRVALVSALVIALGLIIAIVIPTQMPIFFVLGACFVACYTLILAMTQALISRLAAQDQGAILGMRQSFQAAGQVVGSLAAGALFSLNVYWPFLLAVAGLLVAVIISFQIKHSKGGGQREKN